MHILLSLANDLASSIALRYLTKQAERMALEIQPLHIEDGEQKHFPPGSGWVRNTWEDTVVTSSQQEINTFVYNEIKRCPGLLPAKTRVGDKATETLHELIDGGYQLYVMGMLASFTGTGFHALLDSRLMRKMPCPLLIVKNLSEFSKVTLLFTAATDVEKLVLAYHDLYGRASVQVQLLHVTVLAGGATRQPTERKVPASLKQAAALLEEKGCNLVGVSAVEGSSRALCDALKFQGMVVAEFPRHGKEVPRQLIEILGATQAPVLLVWS